MGKQLVYQANGEIFEDGLPTSGIRNEQVYQTVVWGGAAVLSAFAYLAASAGVDFLEIIVLMGLLLICVYPLVDWYLRGIRWLPLGESFSLMHAVYYIFPCIAGREDLMTYTEDQRIAALFAVGLFLVTFNLIYRAILRRRWKFPDDMVVLKREMRPTAMWVLFALWVIVSLLLESRLILDLYDYTNIFNTVVGALGSLGIAYLFYRMGRGNLPPSQCFWAILGFVLGLAAGFANGLLQGNAQTLGASLLAYTLGRKKVPFMAIALSVVVLAVLQMGKHEYRAAYWDDGSDAPHASLIEEYETWVGAGLQKLVSEGDPSQDSQNVFARTSLIQVMLVAMNNPQPYLYGKTYAMLPGMMVPRIFWPAKPRGTIATETVGIYLGIQNEKNADFTGVSVGPLAEGWVNFGWFGMVIAGAIMAVIFGTAARISFKLVPTQAGWLLAAVVLTYSIRMELCVSEWCCSLFQALFMAFILLYVFSNPYTGNLESAPQPVPPPARPRSILAGLASRRHPLPGK